MILTLLGLVLWAGAHFWKRAMPDHRARFGEAGKGIVGGALVVSIILMVLGYRGWDGTVFWGRSGAMTGLNNLLMLLAFYLFASSGAKTRITGVVRHPQLSAVVVFAVAHLLVNGDTPSFVLFGGLGLWALAEMWVINRAVGPRAPYHPVPIKKEITAAVAAVVVLLVVGLVHSLLGYTPFG